MKKQIVLGYVPERLHITLPHKLVQELCSWHVFIPKGLCHKTLSGWVALVVAVTKSEVEKPSDW